MLYLYVNIFDNEAIITNLQGLVVWTCGLSLSFLA